MKSMALAVGLVCALAGTASARELGEQGAVSINGNFQLDLSSFSTEGSDTSVTSIRVAPNGDLFVAPNLSIGGGLVVDFLSVGDDSRTNFGIQGRFGYYLPLGTVGLWLLPGFTYFHETSLVSDGSFDTFALDLYVPLIFHLAPNFFLGLGPVINQEVYASDGEDINGDESTSRRLGITTMVGGAW